MDKSGMLKEGGWGGIKKHFLLTVAPILTIHIYLAELHSQSTKLKCQLEHLLNTSYPIDR